MHAMDHSTASASVCLGAAVQDHGPFGPCPALSVSVAVSVAFCGVVPASAMHVLAWCWLVNKFGQAFVR